MADKSFGVKELNLISASGTPTITSPNSVNINATNVAISTDITVGGMVSLGAGTSISSPGTNVLTFGTNSTEKVRITSDGAIAVGDASQMGSNYARISIDCQGRDVLTDVTDITKYGLAFHNDPNTNDANGIGFFNDDGTNCGGYILHQDKGSNNLGDLIFGTSSTSNNPIERLRIKSNGDIGIANDDPTNWGAGVPTIEIKGTVSSGGNSTRSGAIAFESGSGSNGYSLLWGQNGGIHIYTGATDRASATYAAQFNSSGNLAFASGNGIDFSANSNASGMSSELLDDYEEGTYTPTLTNTGTTPTYQYQQGRYTKIGRYVIAQGIIGATNNNSFSGSVSISIPFTASSAITFGQCGPVADGSGFGGVSNQFGTMVGANATAGTLVLIQNNAALINYSDLANSWYIRFNFMYEAA